MGEIYKITAEQDHRFSRQMDRLFERIRSGDGNHGDGVMATLPLDLAKEHEIESIGRMTMKEGQWSFHFAPRIDRTNYFKQEGRMMHGFVRDWLDGKNPIVPEEMMMPVPTPQRVVKPVSITTVSEGKLFEEIHQNRERVTLVNPSFGAMTAALEAGANVYLTASVSEQEEEWKKTIVEFVNAEDCRGRLKIVTEVRRRGWAYLGTHNPKYLLGNWFYMLPNPYNPPPFDTFSYEETEEGLFMQYTKKNLDRVGTLRNDCPYYVYNPQTVSLITKNTHFFIISLNPLFKEEAESVGNVHSPWFLDDWPEWQEEHGVMYRMRGNIVYDIVRQGTYLSRRMVPLPEGKEWAPIRDRGPWAFHRFSKDPWLDETMRVDDCEGVRYLMHDPTMEVMTLEGIDTTLYHAGEERKDRECDFSIRGEKVVKVEKTDGDLMLPPRPWRYEQGSYIPKETIYQSTSPLLVLSDGIVLAKDVEPAPALLTMCERKDLPTTKIVGVVDMVKLQDRLVIIHNPEQMEGVKDVEVYPPGTKGHKMLAYSRLAEARWSMLNGRYATDMNIEGQKPIPMVSLIRKALDVEGGIYLRNLHEMFLIYTKSQLRSILRSMPDVIDLTKHFSQDKYYKMVSRMSGREAEVWDALIHFGRTEVSLQEYGEYKEQFVRNMVIATRKKGSDKVLVRRLVRPGIDWKEHYEEDQVVPQYLGQEEDRINDWLE